ncbi:ras and Rab interactor-like protein isoform X2 [Octodon degus]|uniref:Ras and Rab interactor-like protein isoform X2 n=1 Tax=Octodon degus TaxID=10160 RepID=A0A6P6EYB5_OCTDE|nr:ras and Rab interactor-like protein isoform X2 [Octodon degus]
MEQSFLVTGPDSSQALVLRTSPGEINTYRIQTFPGGVSLGSSNLCMPDLPHLLAFLSASRDVLPRTLLLPPPTMVSGDKHTVPLQVGRAQAETPGRALSVVNQLYLHTHGGWVLERGPEETAQDRSPVRRNPSPHRVSWVEDPLSPRAHQPQPTLASLVEKEEQQGDQDNYRDEDEDFEDELTVHIRTLARARSSYVARQYRALRARLASDFRGPNKPGDPATELLQDVRHLLADLQEYLAKDPDVRSIFGSRGPGGSQKDNDLGPAVETAVCRVVLAPLKPTLWTRLRTLRAQELRRLRRRQIALRAGTGPEGQSPAPALRNRIHARLEHLHAACSPRRKVALLLAACSDVYAGLAGGEKQEPLGADAFLPALTEELIWSPHIAETQLDVEFLMELLDPEELQGEAGYYLTTWFGALHHIAHYQPETGRAPRGLSSEASASLRQWHRRRTMHGQNRPEAQAQLPFEEPWAVGTVMEAVDD